MTLSTSEEQRSHRCAEALLWRDIDADGRALGCFERRPQCPHGGVGVHAFGFPISLAGVATADREDLLRQRCISPDRLFVVTAVFRTQLAAGLERDPLQGKLTHRLGNEQGSIFAYLGIGGA